MIRINSKLLKSNSKYGKSKWIFLHGILGSSNSFNNIFSNKNFKVKSDIYSLDLRNHGHSGHSSEMSIDIMTEDILNFMELNNMKDAKILGHSLGGRVGMNLSLKYPEKVEKLMVIDMGPFDYWDHSKFPHFSIPLRQFYLLNNLNLEEVEFRDLERTIDEKITEGNHNQTLFYMSNLISLNKERTKWKWRVNFDSICQNYYSMLKVEGIMNKKFEKDFMVVAGAKSHFVPLDRIDEYKIYFPNFTKEKNFKLLDCNHWVYHEKPEEFIKIFLDFDAR